MQRMDAGGAGEAEPAGALEGGTIALEVVEIGEGPDRAERQDPRAAATTIMPK